MPVLVIAHAGTRLWGLVLVPDPQAQIHLFAVLPADRIAFLLEFDQAL